MSFFKYPGKQCKNTLYDIFYNNFRRYTPNYCCETYALLRDIRSLSIMCIYRFNASAHCIEHIVLAHKHRVGRNE